MGCCFTQPPKKKVKNVKPIKDSKVKISKEKINR